MIRKMLISLSLILSIISQPSFATREIMLSMGSDIEFNFQANEAQVFTNAFPWLLNVSCTITCDDVVKNAMQVNVLKKNGSLNNMPLKAGDFMCLDVYNRDTFKISAVSGAKVQIKNIGQGPIKASCAITN